MTRTYQELLAIARSQSQFQYMELRSLIKYLLDSIQTDYADIVLDDADFVRELLEAKITETTEMVLFNCSYQYGKPAPSISATPFGHTTIGNAEGKFFIHVRKEGSEIVVYYRKSSGESTPPQRE
jgi:hypothetical protein